MSLTKISLYDDDGIERLRKVQRIDPQKIREFRNRLCKRFASDNDVHLEFPFASNFEIHALQIDKQFDSNTDGATKLLMRTRLGTLIESVILRIASGRTTLCVSSQVGCAAACEFCATGKMAVTRNLRAEEIVDQVLLAGQTIANERMKVRNIVFMGMGEPFHNEAEFFRSIRLLSSPNYFAHSPSRIMVSSVGVIDGMIRCAEQFPTVRQAISLHSVRQHVRESIIPLARKFSLDDLQIGLRRINSLQSSKVMVEYLMLAGVNDSLDDAAELLEWLNGLRVHVNLIPYNPISEASHLICSDDDVVRNFSNALKSAGLPVTRRYSLGSDIAAACGQLVRKESRRIDA